ncbi:uncharacterized protein LOC128954407 [Oppia nitens]|uniref:uncharacterized protein LOC128954407 n=1 Tax=Oppia nitens TaxID=1686743 RepID=UPI0023DCBEDB|nr:uncharacterized protein LOC128954407 [Oppia nitens]
MTTTTAMTSAKKDSFDRFGDDLCQLLLQYLPIDDRLRLESVSKQWLALIFNTQTDLVFDRKLLKTMSLNSWHYYYQSIKLFEVIVSKCPNITAVTISDGSRLPGCVHAINSFMNLLIINCHRLRHISIKHDYYCQWSVIDRTFERFFRRFGRQLLTFKFEGTNHEFNKQLFYEVVDGMPNLKTLDITYDSYESTVQLNDILIDNMCDLLPESLQSLNIKLAESSMTLFAKFAYIYGKQLTSLKIMLDQSTDEDNDYDNNADNYDNYDNNANDYNNNADEDDDDDYDEGPNWNKWDLKTLLTGFEQIPRLRQLSFDLPFDFDINFIGDLFSTIGRNCRQLKSLDYKSDIINLLTIERMFITINKHMSKQLRRLSVKCWNYIKVDTDLVLTSSLLKRLTGLTHLTLELKSCDIIDNQFFNDIHLNLPRLQSIHCNDVAINDESIITMGQLANLTDVYIRCNRNKFLTTSKSIISRHLLIGYIPLRA